MKTPDGLGPPPTPHPNAAPQAPAPQPHAPQPSYGPPPQVPNFAPPQHSQGQPPGQPVYGPPPGPPSYGQAPPPPPQKSSGPLIGGMVGLGLLLAVGGLAGGLYLGAKRDAPASAPAATLSATPAPADDAQASATAPEASATDSDASASTSTDASSSDAPSSDAVSNGAGEQAAAGGVGTDSRGQNAAVPGKSLLQTEGQPNEPYTVYINGQKAKDYVRKEATGTDFTKEFNKKFEQTDVTGLLKPGENTLRVVWSQPVGTVHAKVARATPGGAFGNIVELKLYDVNEPALKAPGEKTMTFVIPQPNDPASGPLSAAQSLDKQVLIEGYAGAAEMETVTCYINGRKIGEFQEHLKLDITAMCKPGQNTLRVTWDRPNSNGGAEIAYARTKNQFGTIAKVSLGLSNPKPGEKSINFFLPAS